MILRPSPMSTRHFTFDPDTRRFVAEASDLPDRGRLERVYDDAIDEGLTLVSSRTGQEVVFALEHTEYRDGDLLWEDFKPVKGAARAGGALPSVTVRIFND